MAGRHISPLTGLTIRRLTVAASQAEVSAASGIPQPDVSRFERGERTPSPEQMARLDRAFEVIADRKSAASR